MFLLDTCVLYWLASDPSKLSGTAADVIRDNQGLLRTSTISAFEVALNHRKGRVVLPSSPESWFRALLRRYRIRSVPIGLRAALLAPVLPPLHNDPADRIIVATAQVHSFTILTPDRYITAYPGVTVLW